MDFSIPQHTFARMVAFLRLPLVVSSIAVTAGDITCRLLPEEGGGSELGDDIAKDARSRSVIRTEDDELANHAVPSSTDSVRESVECNDERTSVSPGKSTSTPTAGSSSRSSSGIPMPSQPAPVSAIGM